MHAWDLGHDGLSRTNIPGWFLEHMQPQIPPPAGPYIVNSGSCRVLSINLNPSCQAQEDLPKTAQVEVGGDLLAGVQNQMKEWKEDENDYQLM